ncbi:hypothetical protein OQA88_5148 [Cercophora sp. LCS_1]
MENSDDSDATISGTFQDLLEELDAIDHNSGREPLAGMAFLVSPTEYLTILQSDQPLPGPFDYSCGILYFKSRTSWIHSVLTRFFARTFQRHIMDVWAKNAAVNELLGSALAFRTGVRDDDNVPTIYFSPDVAILLPKDYQDDFSCPPLVIEVMYAHKFSCEQAEERYKKYFRTGDHGVQVLICLRLHYARGVDRAKKTAEDLNRSSVSMWVMDKDGNIQTILPTGDIPLRIPFTSIVERLREACKRQLESDAINDTLPKKPRVKKTETSNGEVEKLQQELQAMKEALRSKDRELLNKGRELLNKGRELLNKDRDIRRMRREDRKLRGLGPKSRF